MHKLIILRGNSGSGKTTVSKELQKRIGRNTMLISQDMVRLQMLYAKDAEALSLIIQLLKYGRQNSDITILEGLLCRYRHNNPYADILEMPILGFLKY